MQTTSTPTPDQLVPQPPRLNKKPGKLGFKDFQPSNPTFQPTDICKFKCTGILQGQGAVVTIAQDIWALIRLGSYGKGTFSRSVPCHHRIPSISELKQMSMKRKCSGTSTDVVLEKWTKRIKLHSQWMADKESAGEIESESEQDVTDTVLELSESVSRGRSEVCDGFEELITKLKTIQRKDPYVLDEYLQLGAEETFYLVGEVKVLIIVTIDGVELAPKDLWLYFGEQNHSFPIRYAAYKHFRVGNWVPKSGLKFGVDFLLYREGPLFYHSAYSVVVRENEEQGGSGLKWKEVITLNRVSEAAGKDLLLCDVTRPPCLEVENSLMEPACIDQMTVTDTVVKWWVPKRDREM